MTTSRRHRFARIAVYQVVIVLCSVTLAFAQPGAPTPAASESIAAAVKANPQLVKDLAKEMNATPEDAAATAGALFGIAKSFLSPDDFALVAKAVPAMDALLAVVPPDPGLAAPGSSPVVLTPGFATSQAPVAGAATPSQAPVLNAAPTGMSSAISILSKMGINPAMIGKAIPFLMDYLKKNGSKAVEGLLGQVFKTSK